MPPSVMAMNLNTRAEQLHQPTGCSGGDRAGEDQLAFELVKVSTVSFILRSFAKNWLATWVAETETSFTSWTPLVYYTLIQG
jgi:hypothetical protein